MILTDQENIPKPKLVMSEKIKIENEMLHVSYMGVYDKRVNQVKLSSDASHLKLK